MSIIDAIQRNTQEKKDIKELAKLPQTLIMQMGQRKELSQEEVAMIISAKADMIDQAAKQKALAQGGGQMPSVMEQDMMKIAQAENPAPQQMQQPMMPQQTAQAPMPQLPENVGIAQNPIPPMQMAGGGIIAFDEGGDVDEEDEYQDLIDQAQEDETSQNIFDLISEMGNDVVSNAGAGITAVLGNKNTESTGTGFQSFSAPDNKNSEFGIKAGRGEDKGNLIDRLRAEIMQKESGGRRYDKNGNLLTSSKGALGEMQVMPATARDPGFGIKPARDNSPDELRRVGDEYASVLLNRYQDPKLAMIAYNMGPGATDKWLAAGADIRKLPKETQGYIRGVNLASGGEVERYQTGGYRPLSAEAANFLQQQKDRDTPTKSTQSVSNKQSRPSMIGSDANVYPGASDLNYYNELVAALEKDPTYEPYKQEMEKLLKRNPALLTAKQPATNIIGPLANVQRKKDSGAAPVGVAKVIPPSIPDELKNAQIAPPQQDKPAAPPPAAETPQADAEKDTYNLMKYIQDRQAKMDKAAEGDKNLALLAAGLGMLGGTSPYAFTNIGQGGLAGVQQLGQLQKLRATQGIASDKMLGTAYNAEMLGKLRRDQLVQNKELRQDKMAQDLITNRNSYIQKRMKDYNMDEMMLGNLRRQQAKGKLTDPDKIADLKFYEQQIRNIEREANRMFPSRGTSGVIKLD